MTIPILGHHRAAPLTRREMLSFSANGFGAVALLALLSDKASAGVAAPELRASANSLSPRAPHYAAKARNIIFLHMDGGPSQVDTFDPKPRLTRENGQPFKMSIEPTQFNNNGNTLGSPWKFHPRGRSGLPVSDLFPRVGACIDDIAVIRSMTSNFSEHTNANYFLHTGAGQQGRPSMGSWVCYGLGSESQNLPGFIVLNGGLIPVGGLDNFNNGFLPATYQGSVFQEHGNAVANIKPREPRPALQINKLDLMKRLDAGLLDRLGHADQLESAIANHELAFRMQMAVPDVMNVDQESRATKQLYGLEADFSFTRSYGVQCLVARRLLERGVRFIELTCPKLPGHDRWDQHNNLKNGHEDNARTVDQPIAGLLTDLKARGLLASTLVIWAGEFGRTPFAQGKDGRDHNPFGFTVWMAGGGVKGGIAYGSTDEYGYKVVENKAAIHDLHATMLHLLGLDHKKLTFRWGGRDMRLTDVHGELIREILA